MNQEDLIQETTCYVLFHPENGFVKNRGRPRTYSHNISDARVYTKRNHASNSRHIGDIVIPVKLSVNEEDIATAILNGD